MDREELKARLIELRKSEYEITAPGIRGVGLLELVDIIDVVINADIDTIENKLKDVHKYSPDTIRMEKSWQSNHCDQFNENCNCYLPDIEFEEYWCQLKRKEKLENDNKLARHSPEYSDWRKAVFERDNYTCQKCGQVGGELNAHHIKPFAKHKKLRYKLDNGITLCKSCHRKEHSKKK